MKWQERRWRNGQMTLRFYWDIFLILNVIMNVFLISMTAIVRRKFLKKRRMILAALLGSVEMTLAVLWYFKSLILERKTLTKGMGGRWQTYVLIVTAVFVALQMLQITFCERQIREMIRDFLNLCQVSVVTGGTLFICREWFGKGNISELLMVLAGTVVVFCIFYVMEYYMRHDEKRANTMDGIIIMESGNEYPVRVLVDTGNGLVSPYSGERVMIMSEKIAARLDVAKGKAPLFIPFHSIGGNGVLPAYRIYCLRLPDGSEYREFLAAVSPKLSEDPAIHLIMYGRK